MQISEEFYDFCLYLHQDSAEVYGFSIEDIIDGALRHMKPAQRLLLRDFIRRLIAGSYSDDELARLYQRTDAELGFRNPGGLRHFLTMVFDRIDDSGLVCGQNGR